jgi:hypothetical protein
VRIPYKMNMLGNLLRTKQINENDPYKKSGVCQLICLECMKTYTGQTGRSFHERFKVNFNFTNI